MQTIPPGKPGQILVLQSDGSWKWTDASEQLAHERMMRRYVTAVFSLVVVLILSALLLCFLSVRLARADDLPGGVTCEQVVRFASDLNIPNTWRGRAQARLIALTFGIVLTDRQLSAAAQCLRQYKADQEFGCTIKNQTASGECR